PCAAGAHFGEQERPGSANPLPGHQHARDPRAHGADARRPCGAAEPHPDDDRIVQGCDQARCGQCRRQAEPRTRPPGSADGAVRQRRARRQSRRGQAGRNGLQRPGILMHLAFLTPLAALAVLLAVIPLGAWFFLMRRDTRAHQALSLPAPVRASRLGPAVAIAAAAALIGAAAAQPVIQHNTTHHERTDAEAWVLFDISLSMAASPGPRAPDRLERARHFALALRPRLAAIPAGVASFTDRVLPHLFPTPDEGAFAADVQRAIAVNAPPPQRFYSERATTLRALASFVTASYFRPTARYRAVIVLTDGESQPVGSALAQGLPQPP